MINGLGGILVSDIGKVGIDGCGDRTTVAENPLNVAKA